MECATATATAKTKNTTNGCAVVENDEYDPYGYTDEQNTTSFWSTVVHIVVISAGPGILTIPHTIVETGYVLGTVVTIALVWLYAHTMRVLIWCEYETCKLKKIPKLSYPQVVYDVFDTGPHALRSFASYGKIITYTTFFCVWFGAGCYNYIMIGDNVKRVLHNVFEVHVDVYVILVSLAVPFALLCSITNFDYLVPVSLVGNVVNGVTFAVLLYYMLMVDQLPWQYGHAIGSLTKVPMLIGSVIFPLSATGIMIPLKNRMKNPAQFDSTFCSVLRVSYIPVSALYACFALVCSLKYGNAIERNVMLNLPKHSPFAQFAIVLSSFALASQYPLLMYVPIDLLWNNLLKKSLPAAPFNKWCGRSEKRAVAEYAVRTSLVAMSFAISVALPNIDLFLSLCGTVGSSIDSLIFPAAMETLIRSRCKPSSRRRKTRFAAIVLKNTLISALALVFVVTGINDSITSIYHHYTNS